MLKDNSKPIANPLATLREDFDDWAILFDPDLDTGFGLNSVGTFIWRRLDGRNTVQDIMAELSTGCDSLPEGAEYAVRAFIQNLIDKGLAGYELQEEWIKTDNKSSNERIEWDIPILTELGHGALRNIAAYAQGSPSNDCFTGPAATNDCGTGGVAVGCGCG